MGQVTSPPDTSQPAELESTWKKPSTARPFGKPDVELERSFPRDRNYRQWYGEVPLLKSTITSNDFSSQGAHVSSSPFHTGKIPLFQQVQYEFRHTRFKPHPAALEQARVKTSTEQT